MKTLLVALSLLCSGSLMAQETTPKSAPAATNRNTVLLATPPPKTTASASLRPNAVSNAVPPLTTPRSQYIMTDGRVTGGTTTLKLKKK